MNWNAINRTNRIRSSQKAKREAAESARKDRVSSVGGAVKLDELKSATRRVEAGRTIWTFRGKDWQITGMCGEYFAVPFVHGCMPNQSESIPLTPSANRWFDNIALEETEECFRGW